MFKFILSSCCFKGWAVFHSRHEKFANIDFQKCLVHLGRRSKWSIQTTLLFILPSQKSHTCSNIQLDHTGLKRGIVTCWYTAVSCVVFQNTPVRNYFRLNKNRIIITCLKTGHLALFWHCTMAISRSLQGPEWDSYFYFILFFIFAGPELRECSLYVVFE